ncbi:D-alanyl-D-alanine carboxypeptidase/D-alanyl-D-alanine-endopeptidase, partial [Candidatus Zixiibacteriota bacterium]
VMLVLMLLTASCSGPLLRRGPCPDPMDRLRERLEVLFDDPAFGNAFWGVLIVSAETGEVLFARDANKSFVPASNMKLFTTAAALCRLGPDFRFQTQLIGLGPVDEENVLQGPLVVVGSGDPTISGRFNEGRVTGIFEAWADSLTARGVQTIDGDLIGDDDIFDDRPLGIGWAHDYLTEWYAAQISGLSFNDNCVDISIRPGHRAGEPALVELNPTTDYVKLNKRLTTSLNPEGEGWHIHRFPGTNLVDLTGQMAISDEGYDGWFTVHNPTLYAVTVLKEVFAAHGIDVRGEVMDIDDLDKLSLTGQRERGVPMASFTSPSLAEIIKVINKRSQNFYAEQMLKTLGARFRGKGSFSAGIEVTEEVLEGMGIEPDQFIMVDGSGLSRHNFLTPRQVVILLSHMAGHKYFQFFRDSLPIAGVDGTIGKRMRGTPAHGRVWAKTGFVDRVRALSGYAYSRDDEMFIFSMIANNYTVPTSMAEDVQDTACQLLANFSRQGEAAGEREP